MNLSKPKPRKNHFQTIVSSLCVLSLVAGSVAGLPRMANAETLSSVSSSQLQTKQFSVVDGKNEVRFRIRYGTNANGEFQTNVYFLENRFFYDHELLVFYGRDLDGDHYPETWFVRQDIFITQVIHHDRTDQSHASDQGQDAIEHLVKRVITLKKENYFRELFLQMGGLATSTVSTMLEAKEEFVQNEVDLTSLQFIINDRKEHLNPSRPLPPDLERLQALVEQGYSKNLDQLAQALGPNYNRNAIFETIVDVSLIKIGELVCRGGTWIAKSLGNVTKAAKIAESFEVFAERVKVKLGLGARTQVAIDEVGLRTIFGLSYKGVMNETRAALKGIAAKNALAEKVFSSLDAIGKTYYRGAFTQFKYLAQTQLLQIFAEAYDRRKEIYDPNPIIMTKKLFSNQDFLQDFAFMTHESMLQSGIASGPGSFRRRFAVAGVVSMFDSGAMNILVKGVADPRRIGVDTGWEMIIGNLQTQLDIASLSYFEKMAIKQNNPRLKLVGFAIALVDQFTGYVAYSRVSSSLPDPTPVRLDPTQPKIQLKLVPILAEVDGTH